jgi:hypothetical protein
LCTESGELACEAVDLEVVLVRYYIYKYISSWSRRALQEDIPQLPALSRILNIALRRSRVLGASAGHLARVLTTLDAAYACGRSVLKVDPLSVMYVSSL